MDYHVVVMLLILLPASIFLWFKTGWFWPQLALLALVPQGRIWYHLGDMKSSGRTSAQRADYLLSTELCVLVSLAIFGFWCS